MKARAKTKTDGGWIIGDYVQEFDAIHVIGEGYTPVDWTTLEYRILGYWFDEDAIESMAQKLVDNRG